MLTLHRIALLVLLGALLSGCGSNAETGTTGAQATETQNTVPAAARAPLPTSAGVPANVQNEGGPPLAARK